MTPLLDIRQVAEYLGCSAKTVRRLVARKVLPAYRIGCGDAGPLRFRSEEVESILVPVDSDVARDDGLATFIEERAAS